MKRVILVPLLVAIAVSVSFAQTDTAAKVQKIRDSYNSLSKEIEKIENSEEDALQSELAVNELVVNKLNKSWPAVGTYKVIYRFYYKQKGEEHYPNHLVKVTVETQSAARTMFEEIVFDDNGKMMFYFEKTDTDQEHRLYFENGKFFEYSGNPGKVLPVGFLKHTNSESKDLSELFRLSIR